MDLFEGAKLGKDTLKNRIIRSATYEGMCDREGFPTQTYLDLYAGLASQDIGALITGFAYVSRQGRSMQIHQAGMDEDAKIEAFKPVTEAVHAQGGRIYLQIAHAGRQTRSQVSGEAVVGISKGKSFYFNERPRVLDESGIRDALDAHVQAAIRAQNAGFDGVQLHGAHGYLLHQLIIPSLNNRWDDYGVDREYGIGVRHLHELIQRIRQCCGAEFTLLIKISAGDDYLHPFTKDNFIQLIRFLDTQPLDGIEISYGTMDYAFNIFRGGFPVETAFKVNSILTGKPWYEKLLWKHGMRHYIRFKAKPFCPMYNLDYAVLAKAHTRIPIICVGGFRSLAHMRDAIDSGVDFVSLCRPFVAEPTFVKCVQGDAEHLSPCTNCNMCAVMCDSGRPLRCYRPKQTEEQNG